MGLFRRSEQQVEAAGTGVLPPHRSEVIYNTDTALSLGAVFRCLQIISTTLAQLPLNVMRGNEEITSPLAKRPDYNQATNDFFGATAVSMALTGNAYWYVSRNQAGDVKNLEVLDPKQVTITRDDRIGSPYRFDYNGKRIANKNIKQIRLMTFPQKLYGYGPLQAARSDIETGLKLREFGNSFLTNGAIPTGVLSSDQFINQDQADAYRSAWSEAQSSRGLAVLGAGMSYSAISLSPADIAFLENQQYNVLQIARIFGIPPIFLGSGTEGASLTYSTSETQSILFLQTTMSDYLVSIEEAFTDLLPRGQVAKFRLDNLLRADLATRVGSYEKLITQGVITPMEVRLIEGYGPEPVGEFFDDAPIQRPNERGSEEEQEGVSL